MAEAVRTIEAPAELQDKKTNSSKNEKELTKALTFSIDGRIYGVDIAYVVEIISISHITVIPGVPYYIKGVVNVRSKVVPVIDVRLRFDLPEREYDDRTSIIILDYKDIQVGIVVDRVTAVTSITESCKSDIPPLERVNNNKFIDYIMETDDSIKMILDVKKLIFEEDDFEIENLLSAGE